MKQIGATLLLTFRELWAMKITQGVFVVTTVAWLLLSFALNLDVIEGSIAALRIFGFESVPTEVMRDAVTGELLRDAETGNVLREALSLDKFVLGINQFVFGASYLFGTLLGLFATMPLVSGFVEQGRIDLMLSKPVSRAKLLTGHIAGVWAIVAMLVTYLVVAIWLVISFKTRLWLPHYLLSIAIIVIMFGVVYSIVLTIGIWMRSTGVALVTAYGCIFFSGILAGKDQIVPQLTDFTAAIFIGLYHILPNYIEVISIVAQLGSNESVNSWYPLVSSVLFGALVYGIGFFIFLRKDY
ncbi:MAG: ABC transporter permease subunit [Rhodothermia bacterium]|nr:MAG: ABC transporter permease subunit [Rhodothermia bacterium]